MSRVGLFHRAPDKKRYAAIPQRKDNAGVAPEHEGSCNPPRIDTMKTWIKRSLIGLALTTALVGGLAVAHGHRHGWHRFNDADIAQMKERVVERVGSKLALDATQKAKLERLALSLIHI